MTLGKCKSTKIHTILGLPFLILMLVISGTISCQKAEEAVEQEGAILEEGKLVFEGTVKVAMGNYMFVPEAQGFDIVVQGDVSTGELSSLVGKEVKGEGTFFPESPWLLIAATLDVKDESGTYNNVFTLAAEPSEPGDYLNFEQRNEFEALLELAYNRNEGWEGKTKAKVYGRLEQEGETTRIVVLNEDGDTIGRVIVDNLGDVAQYYLDKLRLFEEFWFYMDVKETVPWQTRRRSRELFHADVLFAGLF